MPDEHPVRPLQIGDWIKSNEPKRAHLPPLQITHINGLSGRLYAVARGPRRVGSPWVDTIHLDGKLRRSGWSRVEKPE
jgi:hypothetical protein